MSELPMPDGDDAVAWVTTHLGDLTCDVPSRSGAFVGGQQAADTALADFDVSGYASRRNQVWPPERRGASKLSPFIRHGLLPLPRVWEAVAGGPTRDVGKFRDELLWQEYARHSYARLGGAMARPLRFAPVAPRGTTEDPWDPAMRCMNAVVDELHGDGWMVNQTRMWMASQWSVRHGVDWRGGEDAMYRHLLDGSRAANRLGWQWTIGTGTGRRYAFSRWQVRKRAPQLCEECALSDRCPIQSWPDAGKEAERLPSVDSRIRQDPDLASTAGPSEVEQAGAVEAVWLTAESLGDADPALAAHPEVPAVFVFDAPLLATLWLSGKRLVFLAECLADLSQRRQLIVHRGDPVDILRQTGLAATFTPVPGWADRAARLPVLARHPWPWLRRPHAGSLQSFSAWRRALS